MHFLLSKIKRRSLLKLLWIVPFVPIYKYLTPKVKKDNYISVPLSSLPYKGAYLIKDKHTGIIKDDNGIKVFSISCTHLGCVLNVENDKFICPCHGSIFDLSGNVLKGPALKPLKQLEYKIEKENIIVYI
ncbi:MAG: ubiquinol-cytochrome c reductase iron-sulfur subunit [Mucispirillum sp.]|nr:ubiquinol-cytochrome c reductase iron-sulfur subunit [Mucispirillum sp.]